MLQKIGIQAMSFRKGAFTTSNHIGLVSEKAPDPDEAVIKRIFAAEVVYSGNIITSGYGGKVGKKRKADIEWEWRLYGRPSLLFTVKGDIMDASNERRGQNGAPFKLWLSDAYLKHGDVLKPTTQDTKLASMVIGEGRPRAGGYEYTLRLLGGDLSNYVPKKHFQTNATWGLLGHLEGEASEDGGSTYTGEILSFKNRMINIRNDRKVTDYALMRDRANKTAKVVAFSVPNGKGQYGLSWLSYEEMEFNTQHEYQKETMAWSSRSTDGNLTNPEGFPVTAGAGIEEQLEESMMPYSELTFDFLEDYLMSIHYSRTDVGSRKAITAFTGEYGMLQANRAGRDWLKNNNVLIKMENVAVKAANQAHGMAYQIGYQITRYNMTNNLTVDFVSHPYFDNRDLFTERDEFTGKPKKSRWYVFLDFVNDGKPNVYYVENEFFNDVPTYTLGRIGPSGIEVRGSHNGNYYTMARQAVFGVEVTDSTRGGILRPV